MRQVGLIGDLTSASRSALRAMQWRAYRRKAALWFVIGLLLAANLYVLAMMITHGGKLYYH